MLPGCGILSADSSEGSTRISLTRWSMSVQHTNNVLEDFLQRKRHGIYLRSEGCLKCT